MSAIAQWQGSTTPLNASWLQRVCDNFGITEPVNGSWLIALSFYYSQFEPINGSWTNSILEGCNTAPPVSSFIWDLNTINWESETRKWSLDLITWDTVTSNWEAETTQWEVPIT